MTQRSPTSNETVPILELHALFKGRVQGVGFRWTLLDHAEKFNLTGTVRNLSNGTVELVAQGDKKQLNDFLSAVQADPGSAKIESVKTDYRNPTQTFADFRILHS